MITRLSYAAARCTKGRKLSLVSGGLLAGCLFALLAICSALHGNQQLSAESMRHSPWTKARQASKTSNPRLVENYAKLPLHFEVNRGQTDQQVKFLSRGSGHTLFLTSNEAVLATGSPPSAPRIKDRRSRIGDRLRLNLSSAPSAFSAVNPSTRHLALDTRHPAVVP